MLRRNRINADDDEYVKKSFFQRHPVLKWTLIGIAFGLFVAAATLALVATLGAGIAPFLAIGTAFGIANATVATTVGMSVVTGAIMVTVGAIFGGISSIINKRKRAKAEASRQYTPFGETTSSHDMHSANERIAEEQALLRSTSTGTNMFATSPKKEGGDKFVFPSLTTRRRNQ